MMHFDVIIIGGGIIGFSTAFQLLQRNKTLKVAVLEKEPELGFHQTSHNSGVIHAGVYYPPGSLKAKFCMEGCESIKRFCEEYVIPFNVPGKLIVATDEQELVGMHALAKRCVQNGLSVTHLTGKEAQNMQPGLFAEGAFFIKETGIVDWHQVCCKYAEIFKKNGGHIICQEQVVNIKESNRDVVIQTRKNNMYACRYFISCAGLYADRILKMCDHKIDFKIIPFRGEYFRLNSVYDNYVKHLIYPVPDPRLPFLGVHFTPQVQGFVTVGPSAVLALAREGYSWNNINFIDMLEIFGSGALWKLIRRHFKVTLDQFYGSLFKKHYLKHAKKYFPKIECKHFLRYPAGVRAQAIGKDGKFINDFLFMETERSLHTCNAPSPAATSSLPIGRFIVDKFIEKVK